MRGMRSVIAILTVSIAVASSAQPVVPPDQFFDSSGVRIRYVEQGQGAAVLLIHGYTGTLERHWINPGVFTNLAADYRVIAFDCRGHGKSDKPVDPKQYGAEMARDIVRLLDHLKVARAHIVGFSMGAIIAGRLLGTDADRFITATLVGYPAVHRWTAEDEQEAGASAQDLESNTPFRSLILAVWPADKRPTEEEIRKLSDEMTARNDVKALAAYHRGRGQLVVTPAQLAAAGVPTLGIIGSADPSAVRMQELKDVMPSLKLVVLEGAEHGGERGILRRPEFLSTLREFLSAKR